jgi:glycosyltransferase involved in cell wall biosynthesis
VKKKIWLVNPAAMPPKYEVRIQTLKRAEYLIAAGYDVTIIGGSYLHNTSINLINDNRKFLEAEYDGIKFIHIKTNNYSGNGIMRFYNLIIFNFRLFFLSKKFIQPDIISHIATVPFGNMTYYIAKRFRAKNIVDVVDLWPESFVSYGLISKDNFITKFAYWAEKCLYENADEIVFSMEGGRDYIVEKGWDISSGGKINLNKVHYINNGVDLNEFNKNKNLYEIEDSDLNNNSLFKVVYIGTIRLANNLKLLVDAAELLKNYKNIVFLIFGDGSDRDYLEGYCKNNKINNVLFKQKWIEIKYVPNVLSKSSLNILNYFQSDIWKYGGSQSKSFQYMASGKPICSNIELGYCPITKFNLGISKSFKNSKEYADAIFDIYRLDKSKYDELCLNSLLAAKEYDYEHLTNKFINIIKK